MKIKYSLAILLLVFGVSCTSLQERKNKQSDQQLLQLKERNGADYFKIYDPWEPFNRRIYYFNAQFDEYIFIPVINTYKFITPNPVENKVHNFFNNLGEVRTFTNSVLQFKGKKAIFTLNRFTINSTLGVLGIFDVASKIGLSRYNENFGETLSYYGVNPGPYLVLPFFGPSSLRDATGLGTDALIQLYADPLQISDMSRNDPEFIISRGIDSRDSISELRYYSSGSPFEYIYVRYLYYKYREVRSEN